LLFFAKDFFFILFLHFLHVVAAAFLLNRAQLDWFTCRVVFRSFSLCTRVYKEKNSHEDGAHFKKVQKITSTKNT